MNPTPASNEKSTKTVSLSAPSVSPLTLPGSNVSNVSVATLVCEMVQKFVGVLAETFPECPCCQTFALVKEKTSAQHEEIIQAASRLLHSQPYVKQQLIAQDSLGAVPFLAAYGLENLNIVDKLKELESDTNSHTAVWQHIHLLLLLTETCTALDPRLRAKCQSLAAQMSNQSPEAFQAQVQKAQTAIQNALQHPQPQLQMIELVSQYALQYFTAEELLSFQGNMAGLGMVFETAKSLYRIHKGSLDPIQVMSKFFNVPEGVLELVQRLTSVIPP